MDIAHADPRSPPTRFSELDFEWRIAAELRATGRSLTGYAAVFDSPAKIGSFTEVIRQGAFNESLRRGSDILALLDHNPERVLGRTKSGTLRLSEDARGLASIHARHDPRP